MTPSITTVAAASTVMTQRAQRLRSLAALREAVREATRLLDELAPSALRAPHRSSCLRPGALALSNSALHRSTGASSSEARMSLRERADEPPRRRGTAATANRPRRPPPHPGPAAAAGSRRRAPQAEA